jgi:peptidase C39-like protein
MLRIVERPARELLVPCSGARDVLVSWNSTSPRGALELAVTGSDGERSGWLPYAEWSADERRSLNGGDANAWIEYDALRVPLGAAHVAIRSSVDLDALAVATPPLAAQTAGRETQRAAHDRPRVLDVPQRSQYLATHPGERGWCSPTALAMVLAFHGHTLDIATIAAGVFDSGYGGAGNWAFNIAFAGRLGLRAADAYLADLRHAATFIEAGLPLVLSITWRAGSLPGAPLERSAGHLVVLRGFDANGDVLVNDPAQPGVAACYPRDAFEAAWLGHGGVAYLVAPAARGAELERLAAS